jgi:hypothetical protein
MIDKYCTRLADAYTPDSFVASGRFTPVLVEVLSQEFNYPDPTDFYNQYWLAMNFVRRTRYSAAQLIFDRMSPGNREGCEAGTPTSPLLHLC